MESAGNFVLFFILLAVFNKKHKEGTVIASYVIGYGLIRFIVEFFRGDDRGSYILGLSPSQFIAAALIILISAFLIKRNYGSK
jgi:phosphatidylglycerol:prolipoprotein diacylglycerol transferase